MTSALFSAPGLIILGCQREVAKVCIYARPRAKREPGCAYPTTVNPTTEHRIAWERVERQLEIRGSLPVEEKALRRGLLFGGGVSMVIHGRDDVSLCGEMRAEPHHHDRGTAGAVRHDDQRVLLRPLRQRGGGSHVYRHKHLLGRRCAKDRFALRRGISHTSPPHGHNWLADE
jgi:hypothetical protein